MPLVCSCGATLPEDARFCHRCGKPQRDEFVEIAPEPAPVAVAPVAPDAVAARQSVSFNNPLALRTSLLVASVASILEVVPVLQLIAPILGGFATASLYQKRSGQVLTAGAGAKLGWITAILNALLFTVFMSLNLAREGSAVFDGLRDTARQQATSPAQLEALKMMNDGRFLAVMVLIVWIFFFVFSSLLYMAGGALAARMSRPKTL